MDALVAAAVVALEDVVVSQIAATWITAPVMTPTPPWLRRREELAFVSVAVVVVVAVVAFEPAVDDVMVAVVVLGVVALGVVVLTVVSGEEALLLPFSCRLLSFRELPAGSPDERVGDSSDDGWWCCCCAFWSEMDESDWRLSELTATLIEEGGLMVLLGLEPLLAEGTSSATADPLPSDALLFPSSLLRRFSFSLSASLFALPFAFVFFSPFFFPSELSSLDFFLAALLLPLLPPSACAPPPTGM